MFLAIVDGTGDFGDESYATSMRNSFCMQMAGGVAGESLSGGVHSYYQRGPSLEGYRVSDKAALASAFLRRAHKARPDARLMLAGYSRGGSSVIMAAEQLAHDKIPVHAMFLFDPVARHASTGGEVIPANVHKVWIARRSQDPALIAKYEPLHVPILRLFTPNPMRPSFGGTGREYLGERHNLHEHIFRGSHGALGGVGWAKVTEDPACQSYVAHWMSHALRSVHLPVALVSHAPMG